MNWTETLAELIRRTTSDLPADVEAATIATFGALWKRIDVALAAKEGCPKQRWVTSRTWLVTAASCARIWPC